MWQQSIIIALAGLCACAVTGGLALGLFRLMLRDCQYEPERGPVKLADLEARATMPATTTTENRAASNSATSSSGACGAMSRLAVDAWV